MLYHIWQIRQKEKIKLSLSSLAGIITYDNSYMSLHTQLPLQFSPLKIAQSQISIWRLEGLPTLHQDLSKIYSLCLHHLSLLFFSRHCLPLVNGIDLIITECRILWFSWLLPWSVGNFFHGWIIFFHLWRTQACLPILIQ